MSETSRLFKCAKRFQQGKPVKKSVTAVDDVVRAEPVSREPEQLEIVRKRTPVEVEVPQRFGDRDFVAKPCQLNASPEMVCRQ